MVTEGGLYILTLFDDFGGTYGKSDYVKSLVTPTQTPTQKFKNRSSTLLSDSSFIN